VKNFWSIQDKRDKTLELQLWNASVIPRFVTPMITDKKSVHRFQSEGKDLETFKFFFDVEGLLILKKFLGEAIRELRVRHKTGKYFFRDNTYLHPDKLVIERAGSTRFSKVYFMRDYRTTMFFCNLKTLVVFRREISDTIIDIVLSKRCKKIKILNHAKN